MKMLSSIFIFCVCYSKISCSFMGYSSDQYNLIRYTESFLSRSTQESGLSEEK